MILLYFARTSSIALWRSRVFEESWGASGTTGLRCSEAAVMTVGGKRVLSVKSRSALVSPKQTFGETYEGGPRAAVLRQCAKAVGTAAPRHHPNKHVQTV